MLTSAVFCRSRKNAEVAIFREFCKISIPISNKSRQSNLVGALSGGLLSLCGDLGLRRILKEIVPPRHVPDLQDWQ